MGEKKKTSAAQICVFFSLIFVFSWEILDILKIQCVGFTDIQLNTPPLTLPF